jgi:hypothetical protein
MINTRFGSAEAPGSISMSFLIHPAGQEEEKVLSIDTFGADSREWRVDSSEFDRNNWNLLESVSIDDKVLSFVLDLSPIEKTLGRSRFQADVDSIPVVYGRLDNAGVADFFSVKGSDCRWGMPVKSTSAPGAAPVPAPAPSTRASTVTPDSNLQWRFQSPTGNIACDLNGSSMPPEATCEVREHTYQPKVKSNCDPGWANRFTLRQGQTVEVNCYPGTDFRSAFPVQGYGKPLNVGSLTCVLDEATGVTCKDSTTGHYFQAARQEYEWR